MAGCGCFYPARWVDFGGAGGCSSRLGAPRLFPRSAASTGVNTQTSVGPLSHLTHGVISGKGASLDRAVARVGWSHDWDECKPEAVVQLSLGLGGQGRARL